jgi:uncharacterized protein YndB with AHSA1/START domain
MTTNATTQAPVIRAPATSQVYRVYIKATPEAVWRAVTDPQWNRRYGYGAPAEYELRPGGAYRVYPTEEMAERGAADVMVQGEVLEVDPPRRLVQTWHPLFSPELVAEGARRLTWEIDDGPSGVCRLTVTHEVADAPLTAQMVSGEHAEAGGGWGWILSDLKTLLETGAAMSR